MSSVAPINGFAPANNASAQTFEKKPSKYSDPLMKWPVRGLAFTNDIGAAIMDIAPKAGTAFWVPALMYFGADIYDKYRNDKESYDPDAKRGLKQALFQTFASIMFPIAAVHAGQKTASLLGYLGKDKLSLQTKEEIIQHHIDYMSHRKLGEYNLEQYKTHYSKGLNNYIDEIARAHKFKNPLQGLINIIFGSNHPEQSNKASKDKIHEYIGKRIDNLFAARNELLENVKPEKMSDKMFAKFQVLKETYKKDPLHAENYIEKAAKDTLKAIENNKVFKVKLLKTLGGFISLGLLIQPIDKFVENVIIKRFVEPGLNKFNNAQVRDFKEKVLKN